MLCLNSFCLFILKRSVWIEFPGWRFLWIIVLQTLKERSERFFTFETMNTFLTLENIIINSHRFPSKTHYLHTYVPPLENIYSSNHKDLWHLRRWLQYRQLRTWINDNLSYLTINCDTGQHSQFLQCLCCISSSKYFILTWGCEMCGTELRVLLENPLRHVSVFILQSNNALVISRKAWEPESIEDDNLS